MSWAPTFTVSPLLVTDAVIVTSPAATPVAEHPADVDVTVAIPVFDEAQVQLAASPATPPEAFTAKTTLLPTATEAEAGAIVAVDRRGRRRRLRRGLDDLHVVPARGHPQRQQPGHQSRTMNSQLFHRSPYHIDRYILTYHVRAMFAELCSLNCAQERDRARCSSAFRSRVWSARW